MKNEPLLLPIQSEDISVPVIFGENTDMYSRKRFISKVYGLLWCMLMTTSVYMGLCNRYEPLQEFMNTELASSLLYIDIMMLFVIVVMISCHPDTIRSYPSNWVSLILFTILETYLMGFVAVAYDTQALLLGGLTTVSIFSGLSIYAVQTKYDYTTMGNILLSLLMGLILFGFFSWFVKTSMVSIMYSTGGAIVFSFYIIYDTQMIVGGKNRMIEYTEDDFVIATIGLYLDIINLFLYLLDLLNGR